MKRERLSGFFSHLEKDRKFRNRLTVYVLAIAGIALFAVVNFYTRLKEASPHTLNESLTYFMITNLNILMLTVIALYVLRNLIKLLYERRQRILGFRLKTKMTLAIVTVGAFPVVLFYGIVSLFVSDNLDFWFKGQYSQVLGRTIPVLEQFHERSTLDLLFYGERISERVSGWDEARGPLFEGDFLETIGKDYPIDGVVFYSKDFEKVEERFFSGDGEENWNKLEGSELGEVDFENPAVLHFSLGDGFIYRVLFKIPQKELFLAVFQASPLPSAFYLKDMTQAIEAFRYQLDFKNLIETNYFFHLLIFTGILLAISIWLALYFARTLIVPIENLLEGTEQLAKGNLQHKVENFSNDEMSTLVEAFNRMVEEIKKNRNEVENHRVSLVEANRTLQKNNHLIKNVLQSIRSGVMFFDDSGFVLVINPSMHRLFGLDGAESVGGNYRNLFPASVLKEIGDMQKELVRSDLSSVSRDVYSRPSNATLRFNFQLVRLPIVEHTSPGLLLVVNDLTDIDRSTRAKAWREVAKRIAHEIKNPLTPIRLSTERIKKSVEKKTFDRGRIGESIDVIIKQVDSIKYMVDEFTRFARIPDLNLKPRNVNEIIAEFHRFMSLGLPANVDFVLDLDENIPETMLDYERIKQVFHNLVLNSVASLSGKRGRIEIGTRFDSARRLVVIRVSDNGKGIERGIIDRIFEPYVTTKEDGTGLGLAITERIVADLQGSIRAESEPSVKTTFTIELPGASPLR